MFVIRLLFGPQLHLKVLCVSHEFFMILLLQKTGHMARNP